MMTDKERSTVQKAPDYLSDEHLSVGTKEYLKVLNAGGPPVESLPPAEARKVLETAQAAERVDLSGIEETEKTVQVDGFTIKLNITRPQGVKDKLPVFMFLHGGGWVLGDYPTHRRFVRDLVVESGFASVFVNYTRSPEAKFPQALDEIYAATKWVAANGAEINVDSKKLAVVGNSVGGNMTIATCIRAKENKGPAIKCQILMWPYSDASTDAASYIQYGEQRFLTTPLMKWMRDNYVNSKEDYTNGYVSPASASQEMLKGLPPTLVEVAENDILRDDGEKLGRHLDTAGVPVTTIRFNGVTHDWGLLNGFAKLPPVRDFITFSAAYLKKHLK